MYDDEEEARLGETQRKNKANDLRRIIQIHTNVYIVNPSCNSCTGVGPSISSTAANL